MELRSDTLSRCEEAWRAGQPLKETSDGFPILMKSSMNCRFRVKGTQDIAYVGFPGVSDEEFKALHHDLPPEKFERLKKERDNARNALIRTFLKTIPRLTAEELEDADDGIYTWIYASKGGSEPTFYASRTAAMLELGTVHYSIATAVGATSVHGAGEVKKSGENLSFNFLSGTFMQSWKLPPGCTLEIMQELLKTKLKETFSYTRRAKQLVIRTTDPTLINVQYIELTTYELDGYREAGFVVCIHPKEATDECKKTGPRCARPVTKEPTEEELRNQMKKSLGIDQMKGGVPPTPRKTPRSQFEVAKEMLAYGQVARPTPTAIAPVPAMSKLEGMGGRKKTKKAKKARRKTRRRA